MDTPSLTTSGTRSSGHSTYLQICSSSSLMFPLPCDVSGAGIHHYNASLFLFFLIPSPSCLPSCFPSPSLPLSLSSPQLPAGHDGNVVSQYVGLLHGVGGHHSHPVLLLSQNQVPDISTDPWIHSSCWFICTIGEKYYSAFVLPFLHSHSDHTHSFTLLFPSSLDSPIPTLPFPHVMIPSTSHRGT